MTNLKLSGLFGNLNNLTLIYYALVYFLKSHLSKFKKKNVLLLFFQIARVLHLVYRLVVQPNTARAQSFAKAFLACGGIETLLVLLQREAKAGESDVLESAPKNPEFKKNETDGSSEIIETCQDDEGSQYADSCSNIGPSSPDVYIEGMTLTSETPSVKNLGGISLSISADSARKNVYNVDESDGIVVGIVGVLGALIVSGHLRYGSRAGLDTASNLLGVGLHDGGSTMFDDKVSFLFYALQKAFQAAPGRLMTNNVYTALLTASV